MKQIKIITLMIALSISQAVFAQDIETNIDFSQDVSVEEQIDSEPVKTLTVFEPLELSNNEVIFSRSTRHIDVIDPSYAASYPGGRGPNKLVIYTPSFGMHTATNEYGTEAIVSDNIVTSLSGADSAIPENGIVISGHGSAKNWISQNITVGSKIYVDMVNYTLTVYNTSESYTYEAQSKIEEAQSIINYYKEEKKDYNPEVSQNYIHSAQNYLKLANNSKENIAQVKQYSQEAINAANMAIKTALPYIKDEMRGVWIRPTEQNSEQIISTLDKLKDNGFNSVFLETYFHGKTIFPSKTMNKYGFIVQNENFADFDPLRIWVEEAHKRNIKLHIWFQSFYVGNANPKSNELNILAVHPEWGNKTKKCADCPEPTKSPAEHNGYFLDPANSEVQDFLAELITEIITDYKPDGINLDYIRYPNSGALNDMGAWGFSGCARNEFKALHDVDPIELTPSDAMWFDWNDYRRSLITKFVKRIGQIGKENKTYISTVIFPDIASALSTKQQDWRSWSYNNYVDGFTPLFLTYDSKMLSSMMRDVMNIKSPSTELYAGLFVTFMNGASEDLVRQIFETRKMHSNGVILFDYAHTTPVYTSTLMAGAFNDKDLTQGNKIASKKKQSKRQKKIKKSKTTKKQS